MTVDTDLKNPTKIIHLGTNDLESKSPSQFVDVLKEVVSALENKYKCEVIISEVHPRADNLQCKVIATKRLLRQLQSKLIPHWNINAEDLHDHKHLNRFAQSNGKYSGVQLFAIDLYKAIYGSYPQDSSLTFFHKSKMPPRGRNSGMFSNTKRKHNHNINAVSFSRMETMV